MKTIKAKNGKEVKVFAKTFEYAAYDQIKQLAEYEAYEDSKIRIMPDAHAGKGCTVGTTMMLNKAVTPNLVGVDIGCGMLTVELKDKDLDLVKLDSVIKKFVPSGFNVQETYHRSSIEEELEQLKCIKDVDLSRALLSIGTLGGGNHFIEVSKSDSGKNYLIIHSGSRKLGVDICSHYQKKAYANLNEMKRIKKNIVIRLKAEGREKDIQKELKKAKKPSANKELAHLTGKDMQDYLHDMKIAQEYATLNRYMIAKIILEKMEWRAAGWNHTVHNYIDIKNMILRKGAVSAQKGEILLIPINMRDGSLLCRGKGNPDWNYSAPHGAGRLMSRSQAKSQLSLSEYEKQMSDIYTSSVSRSTLDEAPNAYKSWEEIVEAIEPTAEVLDVLLPIYNYKAH